MSDAPTSLRLPPFLRGSRHVAGFGATASLKITLDEQRVHLRGMWEANGGEPSLAVPSPFIVILLHILEHARPDVVAWLPDNAGFVIKQPGCFIRDVLPPYFAGSFEVTTIGAPSRLEAFLRNIGRIEVRHRERRFVRDRLLLAMTIFTSNQTTARRPSPKPASWLRAVARVSVRAPARPPAGVEQAVAATEQAAVARPTMVTAPSTEAAARAPTPALSLPLEASAQGVEAMPVGSTEQGARTVAKRSRGRHEPASRRSRPHAAARPFITAPPQSSEEDAVAVMVAVAAPGDVVPEGSRVANGEDSRVGCPQPGESEPTSGVRAASSAASDLTNSTADALSSSSGPEGPRDTWVSAASDPWVSCAVLGPKVQLELRTPERVVRLSSLIFAADDGSEDEEGHVYPGGPEGFGAEEHWSEEGEGSAADQRLRGAPQPAPTPATRDPRMPDASAPLSDLRASPSPSPEMADSAMLLPAPVAVVDDDDRRGLADDLSLADASPPSSLAASIAAATATPKSLAAESLEEESESPNVWSRRCDPVHDADARESPAHFAALGEHASPRHSTDASTRLERPELGGHTANLFLVWSDVDTGVAHPAATANPVDRSTSSSSAPTATPARTSAAMLHAWPSTTQSGLVIDPATPMRANSSRRPPTSLRLAGAVASPRSSGPRTPPPSERPDPSRTGREPCTPRTVAIVSFAHVSPGAGGGFASPSRVYAGAFASRLDPKEATAFGVDALIHRPFMRSPTGRLGTVRRAAAAGGEARESAGDEHETPETRPRPRAAPAPSEVPPFPTAA